MCVDAWKYVFCASSPAPLPRFLLSPPLAPCFFLFLQYYIFFYHPTSLIVQCDFSKFTWMSFFFDTAHLLLVVVSDLDRYIAQIYADMKVHTERISILRSDRSVISIPNLKNDRLHVFVCLKVLDPSVFQTCRQTTIFVTLNPLISPAKGSSSELHSRHFLSV